MTRFATLMAVLLAVSACGEDPPPARPNVLLVVLDTVRADHCSLYGYHRPTTPYLEAFAQESTVYTQAWVSSGWTAPSHATLFTGLDPERHGLFYGNRLYLPERFTTLAESLAAAEYRTAGISASPVVGPEFGLVQGFDAFHSVVEGNGVVPDDVYVRALDEIRGARELGRRFFVFINDFRAHLPYTPTEESRRAFLPADATDEEVKEAGHYDPHDALGQYLGEISVSERQIEIMTALYDGELRDADAALGRFLEVLRKEGALDDTMVVILSDHGENLGDHGLTSHFLSLHRSIRRVPLLIRHPARFGEGLTVPEVVRNADLFPTILEVCGVPVPGDIDGRSILEVSGGRISRAIHGPYNTSSGAMISGTPSSFGGSDKVRHSLSAVFDGASHLIVGSSGSEELYDVPSDPDEERNLAGDGVPEALRGLLPKVPVR